MGGFHESELAKYSYLLKTQLFNLLGNMGFLSDVCKRLTSPILGVLRGKYLSDASVHLLQATCTADLFVVNVGSDVRRCQREARAHFSPGIHLLLRQPSPLLGSMFIICRRKNELIIWRGFTYIGGVFSF